MGDKTPKPGILVIDDDAGLLRLIQKNLRGELFEISTAQSGTEALEIASTRPFTLLLVDLRLPDMTGQELLSRLAARQVNSPFIVITGEGDERVAVDLMRQGALDYLVKDAEFLQTMPTRVRRAVDSVQQKERLAAAEGALKREHAFLSAILNTAGALVIVLDDENRIVRFNRAAEQVTGYSAAEVTGLSYAGSLIPEAERAEVLSVSNRLRNGESYIQRLGHVKTRTGEMRLITWSNTYIRDVQESRGFIIKTGIDVTERRRLEELILEISGREQRRIGQDLHDGLGQHLTGIELMLQSLEQTLSGKRRPEAEQTAKISKHVRDAIRQTKNLARGLAPVELEQNGLMAALKQLCATTAEICRVDCRFECPEEIPVENDTVATNLYRIAQEAVNNSVRHGRAAHIHVRLVRAPGGEAILIIEDDGTGFDENRVRKGMGLEIMRYRASVINAHLTIAPAATRGTRVECIFKPHL